MKGIGAWGWMARGALFVAIVFALLWVVTWWLSFRWTDGTTLFAIESGQAFVYAGHKEHGRWITRGPVVGWRLYKYQWLVLPDFRSYRCLYLPLWAPAILFGALAWRWRKADRMRGAARDGALRSPRERRWRMLKRLALGAFVVVMACWYETQGRSVDVAWPATGSYAGVMNGECRVLIGRSEMARAEPMRWAIGMGDSEPWYWYHMSGQPGGVMILLNLLIPAAGLLVLGTMGWWMEFRASRLRTRGGCPGCGYLLERSGGGCPECGRGMGERAGCGRDLEG